MTNPWLDIPLSDYEGHMALARVAQAQLVARIFGALLGEYRPRSVAVLGCSGGNGFEQILPDVTTRVVGVDINPAYIDALRARFESRIPGLELIVGDIQDDGVRFAPVDFVYAALLFEYVGVERTLERICSLLTPGGILATVLQLEGASTAPVTPSPFASVQRLAPGMRLVAPEEFERAAARSGYEATARRRERTPAGKEFITHVFRVAKTVPRGAA